ncbi:Pyridoxamine 5'-phosphate oxidase-related, FMN-binding [Streptococcus anginosus]|nr:Pyridoxamine 5'-phosphate oxidase-related, FMN-binding [Streptococcus anginosus]
MLIPAAGMTHLEADLAQNSKVIVTLGSRDVEGRNNYQGTGFKFYAEAKLKDSGSDFDAMKEKYSFIRKVLILHPKEMKQLL